MFEEEYPEINVKVENVGQGLDHYSKVRTASKAGTGGPDVVQLEYQFISSFAQTGELLDLTPYGAADIADDYVPWVWKQVVSDDEVLAIPQDSGPMGNLYREDIMTAAGVTEPPATWADYKTAAEKVRANTDSYISNMAPSQGAGWLGLLWQAGVKPFGYDGGENVTINVNSAEAKEVMAYWQDMIQNDLVSIDPDFNDEWYQGLNQGKYAGWLTAAWAPVFLSGAAKDTSGLWRAAPLPQWDDGQAGLGQPGRFSRRGAQDHEEPDRGLRAGEVDQQRARASVAVHDPAELLPDGDLGTRGPGLRRPRSLTSTVDRRSTSSSRRSPQRSTPIGSGCRSWSSPTPASTKRSGPPSRPRAISLRAWMPGRTRSSTMQTSRASRSTDRTRAARGSHPGPPPPNHHLSEGARDDQRDPAEAAPRRLRIRPPILCRVRDDVHRTARLLGLPELFRATSSSAA